MKQENNFIVYKATNLETNKVYLGGTTSTLNSKKKRPYSKSQ